MVVEQIAVSDLVLDPNNARKHSARNIEVIANSLKEFGQRKPIVITKDNVVVAGNGTVTAAQQINWKTIDAVRVPDDWDNEQIKAYALVDNRSAELAEWDTEILKTQLLEIDTAGWDYESLGFDILRPSDETNGGDTSPQLDVTKYAVIVDCDNEYHQTEMLEKLALQNLRVRPLML